MGKSSLHWNGGRDSVEGFLLATKAVMAGRLGDGLYGAARLVQVIGTFHEGNLSFGMGLQKTLDCDNSDNGLYVVNTETMEITERHFFSWSEQDTHDSQELADEIISKITSKEEIT